MVKVEVSDQVLAFVRRQAPIPRRRLRLALRKLASERGDIKSLEGPLSSYCRLRTGAYRVLFVYAVDADNSSCIRCVFAERRDVVYSLFNAILEKKMSAWR